MPVEILSRTISAVLDKKLVLRNGQWACKGIGTSWNVLRIGLRWALTDSGVGIYGFAVDKAARFYVGVMSNPTGTPITNGPLGMSASHFVGLYSAASGATPAITRSTAPVRYTCTPSIGKKIGTAITDGSNVAAGSIISGDPTVRTGLILRITKGSPNFSFEACGVNATAGITDMSYAGLVAAMNADPFNTTDTTFEGFIGGADGYIDSSGGTLAVDEGTDGSLNALVLGWNISQNDLEISEVLYRIES